MKISALKGFTLREVFQFHSKCPKPQGCRFISYSITPLSIIHGLERWAIDCLSLPWLLATHRWACSWLSLYHRSRKRHSEVLTMRWARNKIKGNKNSTNPTMVCNCQFYGSRWTVWRLVCTWTLVLILWLLLNHFKTLVGLVFLSLQGHYTAIVFFSSRVLDWKGQQIEQTEWWVLWRRNVPVSHGWSSYRPNLTSEGGGVVSLFMCLFKEKLIFK